MDHPLALPKILVAPLDWGLGHATRCVPIIRHLLKDNAEVIIAASGKGKHLLQQEFPRQRVVHLPGYEMKYASSALGMPFKIAAQIPKLFSAIKMESEWLKKIVEEEKIDAVISDNRYGLHHPKITSVFITHQLHIKAGFKWMQKILQNLNYSYIDRFDECWVPDEEGKINLAGGLSQPAIKPKASLRYIGPLSRFEKTEKISGGNYLLLLLSGPEPQRTILENLMLAQLEEFKDEVIVVRGLPGDNIPFLNAANNVCVYNHLPAAELEQKMKNASFVISRCGYSTVMDLAALKKRSILIPTPGQTEQEYLAKHLMKKNFALCIEQKKFRLKRVLELANSFPYCLHHFSENNLQATISSLIENIQQKKKILL